MKKALVMFVGLAAFLLVALAPSALADPDKSKNAEFITVDCEGTLVDIVVNAKSSGTAAHVVDSTSVGVAKSVTITVFVDNEPVDTQSLTVGKSAEHVEDLITCTAIVDEFVDPATGAMIRIEAEAEVLITPRGG